MLRKARLLLGKVVAWPRRTQEDGMKFKRETATRATDLPHEFAGAAQLCDACGTESKDPRHQAWEKQDLAERERASHEVFPRETGS